MLLVRYVPRLAEHCGVPADRALWLAVLNPLVLFHFVSGAHNDALLMGLMVAGLVLVLDRRPVLGVALISLALLVKAPAALALVFIVPYWARRMRGRWRLVRAAAAVGAVSGAVVALVSWATGLGYGWIGALNTPGTVRNWLSVSTLLGELVGFLAQSFGVGDDEHVMDTAIAVFRGAGGLAAVVLVLVLLARMDRRGFIASLGLGFVAVVALSPVVQPWYLLWGFVLIAGGTSSLRTRTAVIDGVRRVGGGGDAEGRHDRRERDHPGGALRRGGDGGGGAVRAAAGPVGAALGRGARRARGPDPLPVGAPRSVREP